MAICVTSTASPEPAVTIKEAILASVAPATPVGLVALLSPKAVFSDTTTVPDWTVNVLPC